MARPQVGAVAERLATVVELRDLLRSGLTQNIADARDYSKGPIDRIGL